MFVKNPAGVNNLLTLGTAANMMIYAEQHDGDV